MDFCQLFYKWEKNLWGNSIGKSLSVPLKCPVWTHQSDQTSGTSVDVTSVEHALTQSSVYFFSIFRWRESRYTLAKWLSHYGDILYACVCECVRVWNRAVSCFLGVEMMMISVCCSRILQLTDENLKKTNTTTRYTLMKFPSHVPTCSKKERTAHAISVFRWWIVSQEKCSILCPLWTKTLFRRTN